MLHRFPMNVFQVKVRVRLGKMPMIKQPILSTYIVCHSNDFYISYILEPYVATFHFFVLLTGSP